MKRPPYIWTLVVFLLCLSTLGRGQDKPVDSLLSYYEHLITDSATFQLSVDLAKELWADRKSDFDTLSQARLNQIIGYSLTEMNDYQVADSFYEVNLTLLTQLSEPPIDLIVEAYNKVSYNELIQGFVPEATETLRKAEALAVNSGDTLSKAFARCVLQQAIYLNNAFKISDSKAKIEHAERIALQLNPHDSVLLADIWSTQVAVDGMNKNIQAKVDKLQAVLKYCRRHPHESRSPMHRSLGLLANLQLMHLFDVNACLQTLEEMRQLVQRYYSNNHPLMARTLTEYADAYSSIGEIERTRTYAQQANYVLEKLPGRTLLKHRSLTFLGRSYFHEKNYIEAKKYFRQAFNLSLKDAKLDDLQSVSPLLNLANCNIVLKEHELAKAQLDSAFLIYNQRDADHAWTLSRLHQSYSDYYNVLGDHDKAIFHGRLMLKYTAESFVMDHQRIGIMSNGLASIYFDAERLDSALHYSQQALDGLQYEETLDTSTVNPVNHTELVSTLGLRGQIFYRYYEKSGKKEWLNQSSAEFDEAIRLIKELRHFMNSQTTRQTLGAMYFDVYAGAIKTAVAIYRLQPNQKNLNKIYSIIQSSKAQALLENIYDSKLKDFTGVPSNLLEQERDLQQRVALLERLILDQPFRSDQLKEELFVANQELENLVHQFKTKYPEYYGLKYDNATVDIEDVMSRLKENEALIEFFIGKNTFFTLVFYPDSAMIVSSESVDSLELFVNQFRQSVSSIYLAPEKSEILYSKFKADYAESGWELYQLVLGQIPNLPERIVIIPDGILGYIPFEALLSERVRPSVSYADYPYLIRDYLIYYQYSSVLWCREREDRTTRAELLAFAPSFEGNPSQLVAIRQGQLLPLTGNIDEVLEIGRHFSGQILTGKKATKQKFTQLAPQYGLLHFATHAIVDDRQIDQSFLALTPDEESNGDDHIYIRDLYNTEIPAELVVLSACETGLGKLQRGEGIISLARGFAYAGAQSVVTSLWTVSDQSTAIVMKSFYENLKNGLPKDEALRNAKLELLNRGDRVFAAPFYWAASIAIGDMEPIKPASDNYLLVIIGGLAIVLFLFFYLRKSKRMRDKLN